MEALIDEEKREYDALFQQHYHSSPVIGERPPERPKNVAKAAPRPEASQSVGVSDETSSPSFSLASAGVVVAVAVLGIGTYWYFSYGGNSVSSVASEVPNAAVESYMREKMLAAAARKATPK